MKTLLLITLAALLTGCGTTPDQWADMLQDANRYSSQGYTYTDSVQIEPLQNEPIEWEMVPNSYSTQNNGTVRYMLNTPQGIQYRTCTNVAGNNVYCH